MRLCSAKEEKHCHPGKRDIALGRSGRLIGAEEHRLEGHHPLSDTRQEALLDTLTAFGTVFIGFQNGFTAVGTKISHTDPSFMVRFYRYYTIFRRDCKRRVDKIEMNFLHKGCFPGCAAIFTGSSKTEPHAKNGQESELLPGKGSVQTSAADSRIEFLIEELAEP